MRISDCDKFFWFISHKIITKCWSEWVRCRIGEMLILWIEWSRCEDVWMNHLTSTFSFFLFLLLWRNCQLQMWDICIHLQTINKTKSMITVWTVVCVCVCVCVSLIVWQWCCLLCVWLFAVSASSCFNLFVVLDGLVSMFPGEQMSGAGRDWCEAKVSWQHLINLTPIYICVCLHVAHSNCRDEWWLVLFCSGCTVVHLVRRDGLALLTLIVD